MAVFLGQGGLELAFEFFDSSGGFQAIGQVLQFATGALLAEGMAQAVQALGLPPLASVVAEAAVGEVLIAFVFQEQNRRPRDLGPGPHRAIVLEAVLREAQRRLQFFKDKLDLPAERVQLDHLAGTHPGGVGH